MGFVTYSCLRPSPLSCSKTDEGVLAPWKELHFKRYLCGLKACYFRVVVSLLFFHFSLFLWFVCWCFVFFLIRVGVFVYFLCWFVLVLFCFSFSFFFFCYSFSLFFLRFRVFFSLYFFILFCLIVLIFINCRYYCFFLPIITIFLLFCHLFMFSLYCFLTCLIILWPSCFCSSFFT